MSDQPTAKDLAALLEEMAVQFDYWRTWDEAKRTVEGIKSDDDTRLMVPPAWPSYRVLKTWAKLMRDASQAICPINQRDGAE